MDLGYFMEDDEQQTAKKGRRQATQSSSTVGGGGWSRRVEDWRWLFEIEGRIGVGCGSKYGGSDGREVGHDVGEERVAFGDRIHC